MPGDQLRLDAHRVDQGSEAEPERLDAHEVDLLLEDPSCVVLAKSRRLDHRQRLVGGGVGLQERNRLREHATSFGVAPDAARLAPSNRKEFAPGGQARVVPAGGCVLSRVKGAFSNQPSDVRCPGVLENLFRMVHVVDRVYFFAVI